jgi:acyl-CoA synthetase (AMP-forming)/AMP-acid ligase II
MNLGMYTARNARFWGARAALLFRDREISFLDLERRSNRLAHALRALGLRRGDRVAIVSPNRPEIVELECALYKAGLVKVALNARLAPGELVDALRLAQPAACLAGEEHRSMVTQAAASLPALRYLIGLSPNAAPEDWLDYETLLSEAPDHHVHEEMRPDDVAVLHFTSGSTGKVKAAMQTVGNRMASLRKVVMGRMHAQKDDVLLLCGPITHASGMFIQPTLYQGSTVLLMERFQPAEVLEAIERHRVTICFFVPAMINALLAEPTIRTRDLSSLRLLSYGASPISPGRIREAWAAFGPVLSQGYGAGETTGGVINLSIEDHLRAIEGGRPELLSSCGRPSCESEVEVLDAQGVPVRGDEIGEICVRGPDVFAGFWQAPEATREALGDDGWLRTGDLAKVDAEGYIFIVDRRKEMLVTGGFNVYPSEVESVLAQHEGIYEVCVIGVPDERWGEAVKAVVVLREGAQVRPEDLMDYCRGRLADFKRPRSVDFVGHLPKNANGKLSRKDVREPYWRGRERQVN